MEGHLNIYDQENLFESILSKYMIQWPTKKDFISQVTKVKNLRIVKCICVLLNVFAYC